MIVKRIGLGLTEVSVACLLRRKVIYYEERAEVAAGVHAPIIALSCCLLSSCWLVKWYPDWFLR